MTQLPMLLGAGLACALGGAIAGNALGSTPITNRSAIGSFYQSHETAMAEPQDRRPLPDRYPLVTRAGVVPVAQLSDRGLFSQARYGSSVAAASYSASIDDEPGPGFEDSYLAASQAVPAMGADPSVETQTPEQAERQARIIDVPATLAMR